VVLNVEVADNFDSALVQLLLSFRNHCPQASDFHLRVCAPGLRPTASGTCAKTRKNHHKSQPQRAVADLSTKEDTRDRRMNLFAMGGGPMNEHAIELQAPPWIVAVAGSVCLRRALRWIFLNRVPHQ